MEHLELIAVIGTVFIIFVIALVALRAAYQFKGDAAAFKERMLHYKDLAETRAGHIEIQRDRIISLNKSLVTLNEQLDVVKAVNSGDNRFATQDRFEDTQVMSIEGMITPYQKQK